MIRRPGRIRIHVFCRPPKTTASPVKRHDGLPAFAVSQIHGQFSAGIHSAARILNRHRRRLTLFLIRSVILHSLLHNPPILLLFMLKQIRKDIFKGREFFRVMKPNGRKLCVIVDQPGHHAVKILLFFAFNRNGRINFLRRQAANILKRNTSP